MLENKMSLAKLLNTTAIYRKYRGHRSKVDDTGKNNPQNTDWGKSLDK
jgi:hypothetical protein